METVQFNSIKNTLTKYVEQSAELAKFCVIDNSITLDHLTIGQAKGLIARARDLVSKTDSFFTADLYHIIGMGNLSASQSAILNKLVKEITEHRTVAKTLAALPDLPNKITNTSTYKSKTLGLTLSKKNIKN